MELTQNSSAIGLECAPDAPPVRKRRVRKPPQPKPLTRDQLDGRTAAAKLFDRLIGEIEVDLGGRDQLSTIERALIEAFVGACVTLHSLNTQLALGQQIDLNQHAVAVSAMVRVASRLGLQRRARPIPTLQQYLSSLKDSEPCPSS
jgi:hypothetical protein